MTKERKVIVNIEVKSPQQACSLRVCARRRMFPENIEGECDECHGPIFYDPHPPFLCRKICTRCALPLLRRQEAELTLAMPAATLPEILELLPEILELLRRQP